MAVSFKHAYKYGHICPLNLLRGKTRTHININAFSAPTTEEIANTIRQKFVLYPYHGGNSCGFSSQHRRSHGDMHTCVISPPYGRCRGHKQTPATSPLTTRDATNVYKTTYVFSTHHGETLRTDTHNFRERTQIQTNAPPRPFTGLLVTTYKHKCVFSPRRTHTHNCVLPTTTGYSPAFSSSTTGEATIAYTFIRYLSPPQGNLRGHSHTILLSPHHGEATNAYAYASPPHIPREGMDIYLQLRPMLPPQEKHLRLFCSPPRKT